MRTLVAIIGVISTGGCLLVAGNALLEGNLDFALFAFAMMTGCFTVLLIHLWGPK